MTDNPDILNGLPFEKKPYSNPTYNSNPLADLLGVPVEGDYRDCVVCGETKHITQFNYRKDGPKSARVSRRCKCCQSGIDSLINQLRKQNPVIPDACACCGTTEKRKYSTLKQWGSGKMSFHLDHCHKTKKFRGYLCFDCNVAISRLNDSSERARLAMEYLKKHGN